MAVFKIRSPEIFPVGFIQISAGKMVGTEKKLLKQNVPQTVDRRYLPALTFFVTNHDLKSSWS